MPVGAGAMGIDERLIEVVLSLSHVCALTIRIYFSIFIVKAKPLLQEQDEQLGQVPAVHSMVQSIRDSFAENRRGICKFREWSGS